MLIVVGGLIVGIIAWVPLFLVFNVLVKMYRDKVMTAITNSKIYKGFMNLPIISTIVKASEKAGNVVSAVK